MCARNYNSAFPASLASSRRNENGSSRPKMDICWNTIRVAFMVSIFLVPETLFASSERSVTAHNFSFISIEGEPLPLSKYAGKSVLIVNTASFCGFTSQYAGLQKLWERYRGEGFVLLGVPSNDFGGQEPGTEVEIKTFCEINFDIDFPLTEKVHVKGANAHPFYRWAGEQLGVMAKPRWNFHKYLIAPDGQLVDWFSTATAPMSKRITGVVGSSLPRNQ